MADRLISVPAARSHIDAVVADPILKACMHNVLDGLPAADAVGVVRCKDCKRCFKHTTKRNKQNMWLCMRNEMEVCVRPDDFCSYGERRCNNG
jgi:hypothetical protein